MQRYLHGSIVGKEAYTMSQPFHDIYTSSQGMILNGEPVDQEGKKRRPIKERPPRKKGSKKKNTGWFLIGILILVLFVPLPIPFHHSMKVQYVKSDDRELLQSSTLEMKGWIFRYAIQQDRFTMQLREQVLTEGAVADSGWIRMKGNLFYDSLTSEMPDGMMNFYFDSIPEGFSPMFTEFFTSYFAPVMKDDFSWILAHSQSSFAVGPAEDVEDATTQILEYLSLKK